MALENQAIALFMANPIFFNRYWFFGAAQEKKIM
jgi:hypothetical protein